MPVSRLDSGMVLEGIRVCMMNALAGKKEQLKEYSNHVRKIIKMTRRRIAVKEDIKLLLYNRCISPIVDPVKFYERRTTINIYFLISG